MEWNEVFSMTPNNQKHREFLNKGLEKHDVQVLNQLRIWEHILAQESCVSLKGQSISVSLDTCHSYPWTTMKQTWTEVQLQPSRTKNSPLQRAEKWPTLSPRACFPRRPERGMVLMATVRMSESGPPHPLRRNVHAHTSVKAFFPNVSTA